MGRMTKLLEPNSKADPRKITFYIFANVAGGSKEPGLSGGDRISIELAKRWSSSNECKIKIFVCECGYKMYTRYINTDSSCTFVVTHRYSFDKYSTFKILLFELLSLIAGLLSVRKITLNGREIIFSASDFWGDSVPALLIKLRYGEKIKWVATFWLFAPNPFTKDSPYRGLSRLRNLLYYISQRLIFPFIRKYADMTWVTNELDRWKFIDGKRLISDRVIAVRGGVDVKAPALIPEPREKKFDVVFIGRFHPQKGVLELIDIWRYVCEKKKDAKLAMIGVGNLERKVKEKIRKYGLENNINLFGFKDGIEKLKIFKDSKVVVHPAIYDSGGMAPCEAMACRLPGVSFDLPALRTYYPKGMLKTPCYDLKAFAENILRLLEDRELYEKLQKEALELAKEWDWDKRAEELLRAIMGLIENGQHR